jgi:hypothetical protein
MASRSPHLSDPSLTPFLSPTFDPAHHLNASLRALTLAPTPANRPLPTDAAAPLTTLSADAQALLAALAAQSARLTAALTALTDDLLRAAPRLAYHADVLRADAVALADRLFDAPSSSSGEPPSQLAADRAAFAAAAPRRDGDGGGDDAPPPPPDGEEDEAAAAAAAVARLRVLLAVRARLDAVVRVFGAATAWPAAPSAGGGGLINISAPPDTDGARARAKAFEDALRADLAARVRGGDDEGARGRAGEFVELAAVWKGTREERGRVGFAEGVEELVEDLIAERDGRTRGRKAAGAADEDVRVAYLDGIYT